MSTYIDYILKFNEMDIMFSFVWNLINLITNFNQVNQTKLLQWPAVWKQTVLVVVSDLYCQPRFGSKFGIKLHQFSYTNRNTESICIKYHSESRVSQVDVVIRGRSRGERRVAGRILPTPGSVQRWFVPDYNPVRLIGTKMFSIFWTGHIYKPLRVNWSNTFSHQNFPNKIFDPSTPPPPHPSTKNHKIHR